MKTIMKSITFFTAAGIPGLAQAHVGAIAGDTFQHTASHLLEIVGVIGLNFGVRAIRKLSKIS